LPKLQVIDVDNYGLFAVGPTVYGPSSRIQIVSPLTKESIWNGNKEGVNWYGKIGTIEEKNIN
jgi:hypothetical protein